MIAFNLDLQSLTYVKKNHVSKCLITWEFHLRMHAIIFQLEFC